MTNFPRTAAELKRLRANLRDTWLDRRMLWAERCLFYAITIAPKGHPDTAIMARHLLAWADEHRIARHARRHGLEFPQRVADVHAP